MSQGVPGSGKPFLPSRGKWWNRPSVASYDEPSALLRRDDGASEARLNRSTCERKRRRRNTPEQSAEAGRPTVILSVDPPERRRLVLRIDFGNCTRRGCSSLTMNDVGCRRRSDVSLGSSYEAPQGALRYEPSSRRSPISLTRTVIEQEQTGRGRLEQNQRR